MGGSAARRPRADPAARLHPDRDREFAAAHAPRAAARLFGDALDELSALGMRTNTGDGFADCFPVASLAALIKAKLERPLLDKADWVAFGAVSRG